MPPRITIQEAGSWAAWKQLTGYIDPYILRQRERERRAQAARDSAFYAGAYRQAVLYYSRMVYRSGNVLGRMD